VETLTSAPTAAVANVNDAPVGLPIINGTATEDQILTVDTSGISDADGLGVFSYQWLRNGSAIVGANASSYTLGDADVGTQISVTVSYTDANGTAESVTSAAVGPVANVNDAPSGSVTISGTAAQGQTLSASNSLTDADGVGAIVAYTWQADGITIGTGVSCTLTEAEVGKAISVIASYTDGHGAAESVTSAQTAVVANVNDAPIGLPTISGTATEDQTLTADTSGISDADGLGVFSYQWLRNGANIVGATSSTYTLGDADVGAQISVQVSYTDGNGTVETRASAPTIAVANLNDTLAGLPIISGTVAEDQTLTADTSGINDADGLGVLSYQWLRNGSAIASATNSTYTLGDSDVGAQISVQVSYTDGHGTAESVTSAQVGLVANVNDAPVADADRYSSVENMPLTAILSVNDLLKNDSDIDGDRLSINPTPVKDASHGTLVLNADGTFIYTPDANFSGVDSFTYEVSDGKGGVAQATVTIRIAAASPESGSRNSFDTLTDGAQPPTPSLDTLSPSLPEHPEQGFLQENVLNQSNPVSSPDSVRKNALPGSAIRAAFRSFLEAASRDSIPSDAVTVSINFSDLKESLPHRETPRDKLSTAFKKQNLQPERPYAMLVERVYEHLRNSLDAVKGEMTNENQIGKVYLGSAIVSSIGLSVGYVVWLLRGGMLLGSLLSSLPAWQILDPLPILARKKGKDHSDEDESLESILDRKSKNPNPKRKPADASSDAEVKRR
jgi:VCBS repeat-containing protein